MKKLLFLLVLVVGFLGCKKDEATKEKEPEKRSYYVPDDLTGSVWETDTFYSDGHEMKFKIAFINKNVFSFFVYVSNSRREELEITTESNYYYSFYKCPDNQLVCSGKSSGSFNSYLNGILRGQSPSVPFDVIYMSELSAKEKQQRFKSLSSLIFDFSGYFKFISENKIEFPINSMAFTFKQK